MSESDQAPARVGDIDDAVTRFDQDRADVPALHARLDRLRVLLAGHEPAYNAAVEAYNAAVKAARDRFRSDAGVYLRASEAVSRICSALTFEMRVDDEAKEGESPGWGETPEGRQHERWNEIWDEFEESISDGDVGPASRVEPRKVPLSEQIAALPRRPEDIELPEVGRAIDPAAQDSVESSWRRIDAWLAANAPALAPKMNPGATPLQVAGAEAVIGLDLPDAVRASYLAHDGSGIFGLFPAGEYLTLGEMIEAVKMWRELLADDGFDPPMGELPGAIRRVHFHPDWIPFAGRGTGDHTVIDLAPGEGGVVGQLVDFSHEDGPEGVGAAGLAEYLSYVADGLEAGAATVIDGEYLEWHGGRGTPRSGYAIPEGGPGASRS